MIDGVEVRTRPVPGPAHLRHRPGDREPGTHAWIYAADGALLEHKHVAGATVLAGFDDNYPAAVGRVVLRGKLAATGRIELGGVGKGDWTLRAGGDTGVQDPFQRNRFR